MSHDAAAAAGDHQIPEDSQAHHHHGPAHLAHHFDTPQQQYESAKLGMWLFLVTEILLFGGLFLAYTFLRMRNPIAFSQASHELNTTMGALNTLVLITSSLTMALAIWAAQHGRRTQTIWLLAWTIVLAGVFLVVKYFEYTHKFHLGIYPGKYYAPLPETGLTDPYTGNFFSIYYIMTGIHGLHVVIGMAIISWVMLKTIRGHFNAEYYTPIDLTGLYWHLVDLIWIFLFPLFYLIH